MFHVSVSVCAAQVHAAHGPGVERALSWNLGVVREPSVRACAVFKFVFALFTELTREPYEAHTGTVRPCFQNFQYLWLHYAQPAPLITPEQNVGASIKHSFEIDTVSPYWFSCCTLHEKGHAFKVTIRWGVQRRPSVKPITPAVFLQMQIVQTTIRSLLHAIQLAVSPQSV